MTFFANLLVPVFFPSLRLTFFAPFLVISYYQKPRTTALWLSFFCGLFLDLLSPYPRLGILALNYCLTTFILYSQKFNFFEDKLSTLPFMTFLFAFISTLIQAVLYSIFVSSIDISFSWIVADLGLFPLYDAIFAFACFNLPGLFLKRRPHRA